MDRFIYEDRKRLDTQYFKTNSISQEVFDVLSDMITLINKNWMNRMRRRRRSYSSNHRSSNSTWIMILGLSVGASAYIFTSPAFEREDPVIETEENIYWNRRDPLEIKVSDNSAIKSYDVTISDGKNSLIVANELILESNQTNKIIKIEYPTKPVKGVRLDPKSNSFKLTVTATDRSNWSFFQGNRVIIKSN